MEMEHNKSDWYVIFVLVKILYAIWLLYDALLNTKNLCHNAAWRYIFLLLI